MVMESESTIRRWNLHYRWPRKIDYPIHDVWDFFIVPMKHQMKTERIIKTETTNQTATFVILEPGVIDLNGQEISEEEIIKTAHEFVINITEKYVNVNHQKNTDQDDVIFVESYVSPIDMEISDETIKKGTWLVAFKFLSADKWQMLLDGDITGVSMEGTGWVEKSAEQIEQLEKIEKKFTSIYA